MDFDKIGSKMVIFIHLDFHVCKIICGCFPLNAKRQESDQSVYMSHHLGGTMENEITLHRSIGPSCSKLKMSSVNEMLKFQMYTKMRQLYTVKNEKVLQCKSALQFFSKK